MYRLLSLAAGVALLGACASGGPFEENAGALYEPTLSESAFLTEYNEVGLFDRYDADRNNYFSAAEFDAATRGLGIYGQPGVGYGQFDENDDGLLSENEFGEGLFDFFDDDDNGMLEADEYDAGLLGFDF